MEKKNNPYLPIWFALVITGSILLGIFLGNRMGGLNPFKSDRDKLKEVINYVQDNYVDTMSRKVIEEKAINGLLYTKL